MTDSIQTRAPADPNRNREGADTHPNRDREGADTRRSRPRKIDPSPEPRPSARVVFRPCDASRMSQAPAHETGQCSHAERARRKFDPCGYIAEDHEGHQRYFHAYRPGNHWDGHAEDSATAQPRWADAQVRRERDRVAERQRARSSTCNGISTAASDYRTRPVARSAARSRRSRRWRRSTVFPARSRSASPARCRTTWAAKGCGAARSW